MKKNTKLTIKESCDKIYIVKFHSCGKSGALSLPKCLIGKRIKIKVIEGK